MIGDGYFQLRAQIGTSLYSLASLAHDLGAPAATFDSLQALQARLREPFHFIVIGERGAGKSSLLNALFGRDFAGDPLFSGRPAAYRYGAESREEVRGDGAIEIQRPSIFLRDFTLVEIPAFDPPEPWMRLLATADLMLIVLPVDGDPATAWAALAPLDRESLRRCVFVVQRSDAVDALDLPSIVKRLRHLMLTQLGFACPMIPVSAHTRFGLEKLDRYIDNEVVVSPARCQALREICDAGRSALAEIGAHSRAAADAVVRRQQRIGEERLALGARRDQSLRLAGDALWSLTRLFDSTQSRATKLLERKLTLSRIWMDRPEWWREFHAEVETRLRDAIRRSLTVAFEKFEADLQAAWKQHRDLLRRLHIEPCPPFSHDAAGLFARLAADLAACDQNGAATRAMQHVCARAVRRLNPPAFAAVAAVLLLGGAWFTSQFVIAAAGLTAVTTAGLLLMLGIARREVPGSLRCIMGGRRERMLSFFEEELRAEIDRFYLPLAASLQSPGAGDAPQDAAHGPALDRLRQLEEIFARCTAEIAARKPPAEEA